MVDYFGRELEVGDLIYYIPRVKSNYMVSDSFALLTGMNEFFTIIDDDINKGIIEKTNIYKVIKCITDTEKLQFHYKQLIQAYHIYTNNYLNSVKLYTNIKLGDILIADDNLDTKYVYMGYIDYIRLNYKTNEKFVESGYVYILASVFTSFSGLRINSKEFKEKIYNFKYIFEYLFNNYSDYYNVLQSKVFVILDEPLRVKKVYLNLKIINVETECKFTNSNKNVIDSAKLVIKNK